MSTHDEDPDYEVGYGKPPKATRFKRGQSGNPNGRPKGAKGINASLRRELDAQITVREGNRQIRVSKAEAIAKRLVEKALKGDISALRMLAALDAVLAREAEAQEQHAGSNRGLDHDDRDILSHFAALARDGGWKADVGEDDEQ